MKDMKVKGSDPARLARIVGYANGGTVLTQASNVSPRFADGGTVGSDGDAEELKNGGRAGKKHLGKKGGGKKRHGAPDPAMLDAVHQDGMKKGAMLGAALTAHKMKGAMGGPPPPPGGMPPPGGPPGMPPPGGPPGMPPPGAGGPTMMPPPGPGGPPPLPPPGPGPAQMGPMKRGGIAKHMPKAGAGSGNGRLQKSASAGVATRKGMNN